MSTISFGPQTCGSLVESASREWLVTDGLGGFAMGTVAGLRTRRYHGLLVVATAPPGGRRLGLASLDAVVAIGDRRVRLGTHEWAGGDVSPAGHRHLTSFELIDGVPRWRWTIGSVILESEVAMAIGNPAVGVRWRLVSSGIYHRVTLDLEALATWRDVHGERFAEDDPRVDHLADGFEFEGAYRVRGPGFVPGGDWYRGVHHREEAARGLQPNEDLWYAGRFTGELATGDLIEVEAWAGDAPPPSAGGLIDAARSRARAVAATARATDGVDELLAHAADQFIVSAPSGPTVVAGYPWFGDWSRDTMTSYEGLFLDTNRPDEGRELLLAAAGSVSDGMLANTADTGATEYNTVDAAMWFVHAVGRHLSRTGDTDLGAAVLDAITDVVDHHLGGTRFGIRVGDDGLITQGADGWALTWMDARVDGRPITPRLGKPVEVNALWIEGLGIAALVAETAGADPSRFRALEARARQAFPKFRRGWEPGLLDVIDGPTPDRSVRPNQIVATALSTRLLSDDDVVGALASLEPLVTPLGLRSLSPADPRYIAVHRGGPSDRDTAYHQGTVWPWLIGPYVDARTRVGTADPTMLDGIEAHLADFGLGSISETFDGDAPHGATGCPFQAWSVAEFLRARRKLLSDRASS